MPEINGVEVEDTYCEAFEGIYTRILITAKYEWLLKKAAYGATSLPSTVFGESEGGVETFVSPEETPDGRLGAILQIWVAKTKKFHDILMREFGKRVRQGVLVVPTTRVFDASVESSVNKFDSNVNVGRCGDDYQWFEERWGREMIIVPIMFGEFAIERYIGYSEGVAGGNVWIFCESDDSAIEAGEVAVKALRRIEGIVTSFDICSAGSKVETKYPEIGPTTNHWYCPLLREKIPDSKVPEGVRSIPEIVINGINLESVERAIYVCMKVASKVDGVVKFSAGNFGGKLGKYRIYLNDVIKKFNY
ncbi:MAG: formylmethanofuran--tetrahydromethanopterin formyltransferase [Archaeoglobus sp.]|nr:MAG: formylmethanofuran--tetrahydromethanopterin formyltransferase [Archaeoglobus sp.]